jgi:arsenical pump membrane protein
LDFAVLLWPAAVTSVVVTVAALAVIFRRSLRGRYQRPVIEPVADRGLLVLATVVCALLGPAFLVGLNVFLTSAVAAFVLVAACTVRARHLLVWRLISWQIVLGVSVLFVLVQLAHEHGLGELLGHAAGTGVGWLDLLRLTGIGALAANLVDNLPSYLALEPTAADSPLRLTALLVGVNAGPLVTPWASLATILWATRCRSAGVAVSWTRFAVRGLVLVPVLLVSSVSALWLVHG